MNALPYLLAAVFAASGATKGLDRKGSSADFKAVGVPSGLLEPLTVAIPLLELFVSVGLAFRRTRKFAATIAGVMITVFTMPMIAILSTGKSVDCGCFGGKFRTKISVVTVVRNVMLLASSAFIARRA